MTIDLPILGGSMKVSTHSLEHWDEFVQQICGTLQVQADREQFRGGRIMTRQLGNARVSVVAADAHSVVRQEKVAANEGGDVYVLRPISGTVQLSQDDHDVTVHTGEMVSFDASRAYSLSMPEPFEMVAVRTSHQTLGLTQRSAQQIVARPWRGTTGVIGLASGTLAAFAEHLPEFDEVTPDLLGTTLSGLLSALCAEQLRFADDTDCARQLLLLRIRCYIAGNLGDSALTPGGVARAHNISLRYLQMLFAEQGMSPARWIRDERLKRVRADLTDPRLDHLSVATIGERWGLVGASQISRHFRHRFGVSPSAYRRSQRSEIIPLDHAALGWW